MNSPALHLNTCVCGNRGIFATANRHKKLKKNNETKISTLHDDRPPLSGGVGREPLDRQ